MIVSKQEDAESPLSDLLLEHIMWHEPTGVAAHLAREAVALSETDRADHRHQRSLSRGFKQANVHGFGYCFLLEWSLMLGILCRHACPVAH